MLNLNKFQAETFPIIGAQMIGEGASLPLRLNEPDQKNLEKILRPQVSFSFISEEFKKL